MGSQVITIDEKLFREYYSKLLRIIQIDSLLPDLYSREVITFDQKENCRYNGVGRPKNQVTELLDHVIYRSLGTGCSLFDGLLFAMKDSQDYVSQKLAKEILEKKYPRSRSKLTVNYLIYNYMYMQIISFSFQSALDKKVRRYTDKNRTQTLSSLMKMPKGFSWIGDYDDDQYQLSSNRKQLKDIQRNRQQLKHQYGLDTSVEENVGQNFQPHHYGYDDTVCEDSISVTQENMPTQGFETVSAGKLVV